MPDYFETEIHSMGYFTFLLSASALGVKSGIILEISVDYGDAQDGSKIMANAWARERNGIIKGFIQTVSVDPGEDEPVRIFEKLNSDDYFLANAARFIDMLEQQQRTTQN